VKLRRGVAVAGAAAVAAAGTEDVGVGAAAAAAAEEGVVGERRGRCLACVGSRRVRAVVMAWGGDRPVLEVGCRTSRYSGCPCKHLVGGVTHLDEIPLRFQEVEEDAARAVRELAG